MQRALVVLFLLVHVVWGSGRQGTGGAQGVNELVGLKASWNRRANRKLRSQEVLKPARKQGQRTRKRNINVATLNCIPRLDQAFSPGKNSLSNQRQTLAGLEADFVGLQETCVDFYVSHKSQLRSGRLNRDKRVAAVEDLKNVWKMGSLEGHSMQLLKKREWEFTGKRNNRWYQSWGSAILYKADAWEPLASCKGKQVSGKHGNFVIAVFQRKVDAPSDARRSRSRYSPSTGDPEIALIVAGRMNHVKPDKPENVQDFVSSFESALSQEVEKVYTENQQLGQTQPSHIVLMGDMNEVGFKRALHGVVTRITLKFFGQDIKLTGQRPGSGWTPDRIFMNPGPGFVKKRRGNSGSDHQVVVNY